MDHEKTAMVFFEDGKNRFQYRLKSVIGSMSNNQFAIKCGVKESTIRSYLQGKASPNLTTLEKIAIGAGCSLGWLASGEGGEEPALPPPEKDELFNDEFALIPGYRVQVSAGHGALAPEYETPVRHLAFRRKWLKWRGFNESDLVVVWAKGDSMEPIISDNNSLVVHTGRTRPMDGHIYVVRNEDQLWVKRVQTRPGSWLLLSNNPIYPAFEIPKDTQNSFQVIGQVVHISKDVGE